MSLSKYASQDEQTIAKKLIEAILAAGFEVYVNDGEETTLRRSTDKAAIYEAMCTTDQDVIRVSMFSAGATVYLGWVLLIWGNGRDLISDAGYPDGGPLAKVVDGVMEWAEQNVA